VVITGGGGGIGRALAHSFSRQGARVALLDLNAELLSEAERELLAIGVQPLCVRCDVTKLEDCEQAFEEVALKLGGVDVLVNNAGLVHRSGFADTSVEVLRRVMEVNYFGSLNCTKAALDMLLARRGMVIVVSSIAGLTPLYGRSGYSASKHALHGLFETLRSELGERVHVMMVCPSFTRTGFEQRALDAEGGNVQRGRTRVGTEASAESVADAIVAGARKERHSLVLSSVGKLAVWLSRLAPAAYDRVMLRKFAREVHG
jgi:NAD(P)-dependent dehydrogenase (short-subunit alcohol dehydrogenase family)